MTILGEGKTGGGFPWEFSFFLSPMKGGSLLLGTSAGSLAPPGKKRACVSAGALVLFP